MKKSYKIAGIIGLIVIIICSIGIGVFSHNNNRAKNDAISQNGDEFNSESAISAYNNDSEEAAPTFLINNKDVAIEKLVHTYYESILTADKEAYDAITIDDDSMDVDVMLRKMEYIEAYDNQKIYVTQGAGHTGIVLYVTYDLKINSIDTPAPSIDQLYIQYVDGQPKLYFNELTIKETKQLESIRNNEEVIDLIQQVDQLFVQAIKQDSNLNDFYQAISAK